MTGSDTFIFEAMIMGCDGALIGFAGTATAELVAMQRAAARARLRRRLRDLGPPRPARALLLARADPRLPPAHEGSAEAAGTDRRTPRCARRNSASTTPSARVLARLAREAGLLDDRAARAAAD